MKNIILIGFMGSGKSSVASELAKKMQLARLETDKLVLSFSKR
jgi:shikimate kinase